LRATRIIGLLLAFYLASVILAVILPVGFIDRYVKGQLEQLEKEAGKTINPLYLFLQIYVHNLVASFLSMLAGIVVAPMLGLVFVNGYVVGYVVRDLIGKLGAAAGWPIAVSLLLPHGILEVPAFLLASYAGLIPASTLWRRLRGGRDSLKEAYRRSLRLYKRVAILLLLAAATETLVTPLIGLAAAWILGVDLRSL
jgi:stage II sporulation protein M